jgi:hypothetical protein
MDTWGRIAPGPARRAPRSALHNAKPHQQITAPHPGRHRPCPCRSLVSDTPSLPNGSHPDADVRDLVLGYLDDHPTAMDTLDGIAEWWILRQRIEIEVRRIARVLEALVHEGQLERSEQDGVRFYRRPSRAEVRRHGVSA